MSSNQPPSGFDSAHVPPPDPSRVVSSQVAVDPATLPPPQPWPTAQPSPTPQRKKMSKSTKGWIITAIVLTVLLFVTGAVVGLVFFFRAVANDMKTSNESAPFYDSNLLQVDSTPIGVVAVWTVKNSGDAPGMWSCTVNLRDANSKRLGKAMVVASVPLPVDQATRRNTVVNVKPADAASISMDTSTVDCDEPW